ncbi:MAG: nuclear transport factor 2 family protein [Lysobacter sp.]|nr:nuclear transport factor 2 family protein [Lysobacter sp.]
MKFKSLATSLAFALALGGAMSASAQTKPAAHAHHPATAPTAPLQDVPSAAQAAVSVVERFNKSLAAGDMKSVESLLSADVLILETGGAERSRDEYLGHHAISDAKFLKGTHSQIKRRTARIDGGLAWVGTESELHASKDGKPMTLLSTETMVLKNTPAGWQIVHIHWSSRPKKGA